MTKKQDALEHDPASKLGLKSPVRDNARLGDEKYKVTPPRSAVRSPAQGTTTCQSCQAEIDPATAYRSDAEEYVFHFCTAACYQRWQQTSAAASAHVKAAGD